MNLKYLIMLAVGLLLDGCTVGPVYRAPVVDMPAHWQEPTSSVPTVTAGGDWWRGFHDPVLNGLMAHAATDNLDIERSRAMLRAARAERGIVAASRYPSATLATSATREHGSANVPTTAQGEPGETDNLYRIGFDASWEVDLFGVRQRRLEAASAELDAIRDDREAVRLSVLAEVARNYIDLRGAEAQIALALKIVAATDDARALASSRAMAGIDHDMTVDAARAELATAQAALELLQTTRRIARNRLAVLLGRAPGAIEQALEGSQTVPIVPDEFPSELPSDLLRSRPDIRAAERRLAAATARIGAAQADWYPRFSLVGDVGLASSALGSLAEGTSRTWSIGPSLSWPILRAGQIAATITVRNAEQQAALIAYRQTILLALEDVENALMAYHKERAQHARLTTVAAADRDLAALAQSRYAAGLSGFRGVLAARQVQIEAQRALSRSDAALATDWIALHKALGGSWGETATESLTERANQCVELASEGGKACTASR